MAKKIILTKNHKFQLLENLQPEYKSVMATFDYNGGGIQKIFSIPVKEGAADKYYIEEAKKKLNELEKSGKLEKYCKQFNRNSNPNFFVSHRKPLIIGSAAIIALGGITTGAILLGKKFSSSVDGTIKVTLKSNNAEAYFSKPGETEISLKVAKGTKVGEINNYIAKPTYQNYKFKCWKNNSRLLADELVLNEDITLGAEYEVNKVNVTLYAGGNGNGSLYKQGSGPRSLQGTFEFEQTKTVKDFISEVADKTTPNIWGQTSSDYDFKFWSLDGLNQINETDLNKNVDDGLVLIAIYKSTPAYVDPAVNITFNTVYSSTLDSDGATKTGTFEVNNEELTSWTYTKTLTEGTKTSLQEIMNDSDTYVDPVGDYYAFDKWLDSEKGEYDPTTELENGDSVSLIASYKTSSSFADDPWRCIVNWAKLGSAKLTSHYGSDNIKKTKTKKIRLKGEQTDRTLRIIGVDADVSNVAWDSASLSHLEFDDKIPLTLQFLEPFDEGVFNNDEDIAKRSNWVSDRLGLEECALKQYLNGDFMDKLPLSIKNNISSSIKRSTFGYCDNSTGTYVAKTKEVFSNEKIFLLDYFEMSNSEPSEKTYTQYPYNKYATECNERYRASTLLDTSTFWSRDCNSYYLSDYYSMRDSYTNIYTFTNFTFNEKKSTDKAYYLPAFCIGNYVKS